MGLPPQSATLTAEQIGELNRKLSQMRHDINNYLSVLVAGIELIRLKPDTLDKWLPSISEQPTRISESLRKFTADFESTLGITKP